MSTLNDLTALALPTGSRLVADETESRLCLSLEGQPLIQLRLTREPAAVQVESALTTPTIVPSGRPVIGCLPVTRPASA